MADAIVSFAVERIGDLLIQEAKFSCGVGDKVENIQTELRRMRCFLKDADSKASGGDETVRNWVTEIRDLAYDAEDVIETYALKVASRRRREGIMNVLKRFACILNEGIALHKVGSKIEAITAKISSLTRSLQTYGIKDLNDGSSSSGQERPPSYSHVVEPYFVGRDESIRELVKHLVDNEKNNRIVSIWGMGGLGKTTLAKKVCHHAEVKRRFDYFSWSFISQQCNPRDVWEGILSQFNEPMEEIKRLRDEVLAEKLYQVQQQKRCLVILDDIWSIQAWDSLRAAFPYEESNSKILLTTRNKDVALNANPKGFHYELPYLDEKECWDLLQKIAIPQKDGADLRIDTRMEVLGKEIVKHCGGLPLAITVIGGLLATKYSSNEWHTVNETIKSCLRRGKGHGQEHSGVLDVLALSYNDLPTELKPCFLYLSHFPEDYEIYVPKLIQLWAAEGIIKLEQYDSEEGKETVEDVAERYLNELVKRCMVLVGNQDASLRVTTCRMHDLMRDLCLSKAKEENFLHIVDCRNGDENVDIFPSSSSGKVRRLAIYLHQSCNKDLLKCIKYHDLRSLLCLSEKLLFEMPVIKNLQLLRVLHFECKFIPYQLDIGTKLITDIGKLIHLRYMSLQGAYLSELPSSLGNLRLLQTLNLVIAVPLYIPNVLWKMKYLRHLYLPPKCDDKTKLRLGNLKNLQTLMNFSFNNFDASELLNNITNIRKLSIGHLNLNNAFGETFKSRAITLKHLRSLIIGELTNEDVVANEYVGPIVTACINLCELNFIGTIGKLPDWPQFPATITDIELWMTKLEEDPMPTLEKLPNIGTLILRREAFNGKQMVCSREGFPRLYSLTIQQQMNLEEWKVDEGALPNLWHVRIYKCPKLKKLPDGLEFVKTLKELEIIGMPKEFKDKVVEGGEDFYKVQHVPSVIFQNCDFSIDEEDEE